MILTILRTIIFILSFYGMSLLVKEKLKIEKEFSYAFTAIIVVLVLFFAAILNILLPIVYLLHAFGIGIIIYKLIKCKKDCFKFDYKDLIIALILIYLMLLGLASKFTSYDNFSHWALIAKQLFTHNSLPSFEYNLVEFTTYPPASALFIYYFGSLVGRVETSMIIGNLYFTFIFITPLTIFLKKDKKILSSIIFVIFSFMIINCNIPIADLLVDTTLGTLGIFSCCVAYFYRKNLIKAFKLLTIISCGFIVLKNSGVLFIALNMFLLLLIGVHNKKTKESIKYCLISLLISFFVFILWQQHLKLVYPGNTGITTKHSISITNFGRTIIKNGIENSKNVVIKYYSNILNLKDIILHYLLEINAFLVLGLILFKQKKSYLKIIALVNILYLCYWICLGVMYVLSMPYEEAIRLACYGRYMMSAIIVLFGITYISVFELGFNNKIKSQIYLSIFIISILLLIITNSFNSYKQLFDFRNESNSDVEKIEFVVNKYPIDKYDDKKVYLNLDCNFYTYYNFMLKYKYFSKNFSLSCGELHIDELERPSILIMPDGNNDVSKWNNIVKIDENVYELK